MSEEIILKTEDLAALSAQFNGLGKKIRNGEYILAARQEGEPEYATPWRYFDATKLFVTITPSATNTSSTVKSMSFEFDHFFRGEAGSSYHSEAGSVRESFRIEAASGKSYIYEPTHRGINEDGDEYKLLRDVRDFGRQDVQEKADKAMFAAWESAELERRQQQEERVASLKSNLKL